MGLSTVLPSLLSRPLLVEFKHLWFELVLIDLSCKHFNTEVLVIYSVLFVFISLVYHILVYVKDASIINEPSIEPKLKCFLFLIKKCDFYIIVG